MIGRIQWKIRRRFDPAYAIFDWIRLQTDRCEERIVMTHEHIQPANDPADKSAMSGRHLKQKESAAN